MLDENRGLSPIYPCWMKTVVCPLFTHEFTKALKLDPHLYQARYNRLRLDDKNEERGRTFRR